MRRTLTVLADEQRVRIFDGMTELVAHPRSWDRVAQIEEPLNVQSLVERKRAARAHRAGRPSHWRHALEETARSLGFKLDHPVAEADSLTVQKELVAHTPGLYSILGPYSVTAELHSGRLQASKLTFRGRASSHRRAAWSRRRCSTWPTRGDTDSPSRPWRARQASGSP